MPELGPCPLCGGTPASDELSPAICYDCGFYLESVEFWGRLSKQGELWRLLEWAITNRLQISQYEDGHTWVYRDSGLVGGFIGFATGDTMIDAIREAKKKLEARPAFLPGVFTISRRIP